MDDDRLRTLLTRAADPPGAPLRPPMAHLLALAHSRRRRRRVIEIGAAIATAAVAIVLPTLLVGGGSPKPQALSVVPDLGSPLSFTVAPPEQPVIGAVPIDRPQCSPSQLAATAVTRTASSGVLGVIRLRGTKFYQEGPQRLRCSLPASTGPAGLLDASNDHLDVPLGPGDTTNPPANPRPDLSLSNGEAAWGFSWLGSYCGQAATAVQFPIRIGQQRSTLRIPLTGPAPRCTGNSSSQLIEGIVGSPDEPVQPPSPTYSRLRLRIAITPGTTRRTLAPLAVTLTDISDQPVTLDPCPAYAGRVDGTEPHGGFGGPLVPGYLPCRNQPITIAPGHPLHITLNSQSLAQGDARGAAHGAVVTVTLGIAGVPSAKASVTIR